MVGSAAEKATIRCPWLKLTARATFSQQLPFTELVPSVPVSTAEQPSGTQNHWTCFSAGLFIVVLQGKNPNGPQFQRASA